MTTIFERVESALGTISPAVAFSLAPYKSTGTLPDTFITHQLIDGDAEEHADNIEIARTYIVQINTWSKAGLASLPDVETAMLNAGFKKRSETQLPQDKETHHYGLAVEYVFDEYYL